MHGTFVASGPGVRQRGPVPGDPRDRRRADDRVPDGHPRSAERARPDPDRARAETADPLKIVTILNISDWHGAAHRRSRRRRTTCRGTGAVEPGLPDRRLGVPEAVVRPRTGPRRRTGRSRCLPAVTRSGRRPRSRTSSATSRDRVHEHDGRSGRRAREPQLRPRVGVPADRADPAGDFPFVSSNIIDPTTRRTPPAWSPSTTFIVRRGPARPRSASRTRTCQSADLPGQPRSVRVDGLRPDAINREAATAALEGREHDRRDRPRGCDRRDAQRPDGAAARPRRRARRASTSSSATTTTSRWSTRGRTACSSPRTVRRGCGSRG